MWFIQGMEPYQNSGRLEQEYEEPIIFRFENLRYNISVGECPPLLKWETKQIELSYRKRRFIPYGM